MIPRCTARRIATVLLLGSLTAMARASEPPDAAELAGRHFSQLYGFDALEAYESSRGSVRTTFSVARHWVRGRAKVLIDILTPSSFSKWGFLMLHNDVRSDDLFVYVPRWRRVVRMAAIQLEAQLLFEVLPLGELRPIVPGELAYTYHGKTEIGGESCHVVEGRPLHRGLGFDRVELLLSESSGFALRTSFHEGGRVTRRVLLEPSDVKRYGERLLPARRQIITFPDGKSTELRLRNLSADLILPNGLFNAHSLRAQRFPRGW